MQLKLRYLALCLAILTAFLFLAVLIEALLWNRTNVNINRNLLVKTINDNDFEETKSRRDCRFSSCFDYFKCHVDENWEFKVYVYPEAKYINQDNDQIFPDSTKEFQEIISAIQGSRFWTNDSRKACIFIPNLDILSERAVVTKSAGAVLSSLKHWNEGQNHLIFNYFQKKASSSNPLTVNIGKAMVASASFNQLNFRPKYDIVIPVLNSFVKQETILENIAKMSMTENRKWLLTVPQGVVSNSMKLELENMIERNKKSILRLSYCAATDLDRATRERCMFDKIYQYPNVLKDSTFCLIIPSSGLWKTFLIDAISHGCIPVVIQEYFLSFSFVIDWKRAAITFNENNVKFLINILYKIEKDQLAAFRNQIIFLWKRYFSSLGKVALTTLEILNERMSPHKAKGYSYWNGELMTHFNGKFVQGGYPPLYIPLAPPKQQGFTAVVLTYNRKEMLFQLIKHLSRCPSLSKILIIWNNPNVKPPDKHEMPNISVPLVVIRSKENKLSNRFYPYNEIETEAILSIDDDISMLTKDELEFGYSVWQSYPDRLVGFPGRNHKEDIDSSKNLLYQSEWTNDVSMVLTGVAFYHKLYNYMFTHKLSKKVISFVDKRMNCEDIAMNFLVANVTRKALIKVTARKRFICPQCSSNESLWSETSHFTKRSECLKEFTNMFGKMPLERVEFRADPVLFKDNVPHELQAFPDVGNV